MKSADFGVPHAIALEQRCDFELRCLNCDGGGPVITNSCSGEAGFASTIRLRRTAARSGLGCEVLPPDQGEVPCPLRRLQRGFCATSAGLVLYAKFEALDSDLHLRELEFEVGQK
jgi:hypothetical protein